MKIKDFDKYCDEWLKKNRTLRRKRDKAEKVLRENKKKIKKWILCKGGKNGM